MGKEKTESIKPFRVVYKFAGLVFPATYLIFSKNFVLGFIFIILSLYLTYDFARLRSRKFNNWLFAHLSSMLKEKEKNKISTAIWLLLGSFLTILVFQREIAIVSLFIFTAGDAAGAIFGKKYCKIRIFEKSLEGNLACFVFAFIFGYLVSLLFSFPAYKVLLGSLAATIIQTFPLKIDDNLTMPLVAALIMTFV